MLLQCIVGKCVELTHIFLENVWNDKLYFMAIDILCDTLRKDQN